jgi:hypothetical protein
MLDKENRLKVANLIQAFRHRRITNDEFVAAFPRSQDKAIQAIGSMLWFCYDDLHEHRLSDKRALTAEGELLVDRCILFLNTSLEYSGKTNFTDLLAPVRKLWRWTAQNREPAIAPCWPFGSQRQLTDHEKLVK